MPEPLIRAFEARDYDGVRAGFRWPEPARLNIATEICSRWAAAEPERIALIQLGADGVVTKWPYGALEEKSNRLANALRAHGLARGDRCAVLLPQSAEAALTHLAVYKLGAVALPLFTLFGEDGLAFRLEDAGARMLVTDRANLPKVLAIRDRLPALETVFCVDGFPEAKPEGVLGFWDELEKGAAGVEPAEIGPEDPAFICYTSGTTGPPKGAMHGHRVLLGHLPGVQMWLEGVPKPGDVAWTPADWAWMGGLCNMMMPALHYGIPLVAHRMAKFEPEQAFGILERFGVTVGFLPPTALKMMRTVRNPERFDLKLRAIGSGGESLGAGLLDWGRSALGLTVNEFYGQTECNLVLTNNGAIMPAKPGSMGRATPGCEMAVIDSDGAALPAGETGEIAVRRPHPALFLEYWGRPDATADKFVGDWMRTGDEGRMDEDGYFFFNARTDDVISSAGYRIGPGEVEDCLTGHPAVAMAGVIGVPDDLRGEAVKAYVVLREGEIGDKALVEDLQAHVKTRLSPHEYPREIAFIKALPMTATGKIMRRELKRRRADG